jgi:hypothetical protein
MTEPLPLETPAPGTPVSGAGLTSPPIALGGGDNEAGRVNVGEGEAPDLTRPALVVGLDLSLKRTGIASPAGAESLSPPQQLGMLARQRWIRHAVLARVADADLLVVERIAYSTTGKYAKENAGLWYVVMTAVDARRIRWIDVVSNTRALYATGNGCADKDAVFKAAVQRLPVDVANNDEADAAWMCALGYDLLDQPLIELPARHRKALDTVRPRLTTGERT